jgi:hypothetical protein
MFWNVWNSTYYNHTRPDPIPPKNVTDWTSTLMSLFQNSIDYRGLGDVNADGKVDVTDVGYVSSKFGTREGGLNWDYLADITHDGKVDIQDLARTSGSFGKLYDC